MALLVAGLISVMSLDLVGLGMFVKLFILLDLCKELFPKLCYLFNALRDVAAGAVIVREAGGLVFDP